MKDGWQTSTLGDVLAVLKNGLNCKQDKSGRGDKVSRIESISDASFDSDRVGYAELSERDKERYRLQPGDILFSHINSVVHVRKTAVFHSSEPVYHGVNLLLMRPKEVVTWAYLDHALKYLFQSGYWQGVCKQSVNQASVNQHDISRVQIRYPRLLAEQQRIVGILDEACEGISAAKANTEKNRCNARALFESHLQSIFSQRNEKWMNKQLGDLCDVFDSQRKPITRRDRVSGDIPYYGATGIQDYVDGFIFDEPLVLVGEDGAKWGPGERTAFAVSGQCWVNNHAHVVRPRRNMVLDHWLIFFLNTSDLNEFVSGLTVPKLTQGNLREIPIPLPSLAVQRQLTGNARELDSETQRLATVYERKLAALDELKKSLLHQAFSGQL